MYHASDNTPIPEILVVFVRTEDENEVREKKLLSYN